VEREGKRMLRVSRIDVMPDGRSAGASVVISDEERASLKANWRRCVAWALRDRMAGFVADNYKPGSRRPMAKRMEATNDKA
jgi:hypothetical protein